MASAKNNQLISSQGPHFSPAKTNGKSTNLRRNDIYWYKKCYERFSILRVKKLMMMMMKMIIISIISIMNKSQETTVFHGRQKLTSAMKQRPEK